MWARLHANPTRSAQFAIFLVSASSNSPCTRRMPVTQPRRHPWSQSPESASLCLGMPLAFVHCLLSGVQHVASLAGFTAQIVCGQPPCKKYCISNVYQTHPFHMPTRCASSGDLDPDLAHSSISQHSLRSGARDGTAGRSASLQADANIRQRDTAEFSSTVCHKRRVARLVAPERKHKKTNRSPLGQLQKLGLPGSLKCTSRVDVACYRDPNTATA